jgi:RNA polymerase sigma-70 factor (ECF subfamily)
LSYQEISEITGKSIGALKANYFHAFNKIKDYMEEDE